MSSTPRPFQLDLQLDQQTGQLRSLAAPDGSPLLQFQPAAELHLNGQPLLTTVVSIEHAATEHITTMEAHHSHAYGVGVRLWIRRVISLGGAGLRPGRSNTAHIRYEIRRIPNTTPGDGMSYIWQPEIEAPLRLDHVDVLAAPTSFMGPNTHLRAIAIGGSGPREHVSIEDAPVADAVKMLGTSFRTTFPGQPTINGGLLHNPGDGRFCWMIVRRPFTGGQMRFDADHASFRFHYFADMPLQQEFTTPAVSLLFGRGMDNADRVLAEQFDQFEEPPAWWFNTSWFWLHPGWQPDATFQTMAEGAGKLIKAGVNGFGTFTHDVPWSGNDCDVNSPAPSPTLGGSRALKQVLRQWKDQGVRSYVWMSQKGHRADSPAANDQWFIRGSDGRPIRLRNRPDSGVRIDILDPADPDFFRYISDWIRYYVCDLGITGIFWDSGFQPVPPDFGNKPYLRFPAQSMAAMLEFYRRIYQFGRSLSDDFFMWAEGISVDVTMNGFAVDQRDHGGADGHALMNRLAHAGPQRLVWRTAWTHDVSGAFPFINPHNDVGWPADSDRYAKAAADPMNQWLCATVKERSVRQARGLGRGISQLDEYVIVSPKAPEQTVIVPGASKLEPIVAGAKVEGKKTDAGTQFHLTTPGAYKRA